jgi:hypothetical protein
MEFGLESRVPDLFGDGRHKKEDGEAQDEELDTLQEKDNAPLVPAGLCVCVWMAVWGVGCSRQALFA